MLDGFAVVQEYAQSLGDSVVFRGHGVFRFDATSGHHHLYWFDSMGQAPSQYIGAMAEGRMTMECVSAHFSSRAAWDFTRADVYLYHMDIRCGGSDWQRFIDGEYRRVAE